MTKVAIIQSNYIPWKGYFDVIAMVDEFILYDDAQYTKTDWRNRNRIKTPNGAEWISIPVGKNIDRRIREVEIPNGKWREKHWKTLYCNYRRARCFDEVAELFEAAYLKQQHSDLSKWNRALIEIICEYLGITTRLSHSWEYNLIGGRTERLVSLCQQVKATEYITGTAAKSYINSELFNTAAIELTWFSYGQYPEYPQLWGRYIHEVTILDLLFNCGKEAPRYMKFTQS